MRPYWLGLTDSWIPACRGWAARGALDTGAAEFDVAVPPQAASASAAPSGAIASRRRAHLGMLVMPDRP
jgi:hypothetical protein